MKLFTTAIAAAALMTAADAKGFNGFYAGADLGLSTTASKTTLKSATSAAFPLSRHANGYANHTNLGILLGYNKLFSSCFTAGALFTSDFDFGGKKTIMTSEDYKVTSKRSRYSWGLYATGGMLINPKTALFLGLGVKSLKNKIFYTEQDANGGAATFKNNSVRFSALAGVESLFANDSMALRLTYGITPGKSKTKSIANLNTIFADAPNFGTAKIKTTEQQVKVGITYRF